MEPITFITAVLTCVSAIAAMSLRNLVHCALCLAVTFICFAALYIQMGAEFIGLTQIFVYVGAVAILILFAILLTRNGGTAVEWRVGKDWLIGLGVAGLVFQALVFCVSSSSIGARAVPIAPSPTVKAIGDKLMGSHVLALEVVGVLLTAAMIGAVVIAMKEPEGEEAIE